MNRRPRRQHRDKQPFRVFQANVGKNGPSHDCALALADAERYDVTLPADQQRPAPSRDILCLEVNGITAVNIYWEPHVDTTLEVLFAWPTASQCIIAGDF